MSYFGEHVYPHLVDILGDPAPIRDIRRQIVPLARGTVLEIGVGSGANFPHYAPSRVRKLYALEPNPGMLTLARRRLSGMKLNVEFLDFPGEHLPLESQSVDAIVSTFTLCTIPRVQEAIEGLHRVLRTGGKLIFLELGISPDPAVRQWQHILQPLLRSLFYGLHVTRNIPALIEQGGFQISHMERGYVAQFPKSLSYCWWGTAGKTGKAPGFRSIEPSYE